MGVIIYLYFNLGRPSALGPLDYFSRRVQIKTDEERGVVEGVVFGKTFTVPIIDISFRYQEVTNSVTEPKIGSGMINGQLSTWHTGDYISYDKKTGNVRVYVLNGVDTIGSFELSSKVAGQLEVVTKKIHSLSQRLKSEQNAKEKLIQEENENKERMEREKQAEEQKSMAAAQKAESESKALEFVNDCKLLEPKFGARSLNSDYTIEWVIAADKSGNGGLWYDNGNEKWIGSWKGAQAKISGNCLELILDDQSYRDAFLKERRASIRFNEQKMMTEWFDRITILSRLK